MYHPSNGSPRTANTWGYVAVHEKQEANRAATASHGELPRLPSREGRKKQHVLVSAWCYKLQHQQCLYARPPLDNQNMDS
ncbi:hypothetical protein AVEN_226822-1 [Araneus ventricosus]|uniref:Uncharacterized protein n=1 Tax=Araneus ventricosus TaxID=182803 RepID=A0A4Y2RLM3_ARAVE|nr:hypothetical protein AVEN_226822-1 [Araneus ventricosus]